MADDLEFVVAPIASVAGEVIASVQRGLPLAFSRSEEMGVRGFSASAVPLWTWAGAPLIGVADDAIFTGARTGFIASLTLGGKERWRAALPDDRSADGRERHDRGSTFIGDAIVVGDAVLTAAGGEIVALARSNGAVRARIHACRGEGGTVARLARVGARVIATCTARSAYDDERWTPPPLEPAPAPGACRDSPSELVGYDAGLHEQWRTHVGGLSFGDGSPLALDGDTFACTGAPTARRMVDPGPARLVVMSAISGAVRWVRDAPDGGRPILIGDRVVAGTTMFSVADGAIRWTAHGNALNMSDRGITPVVDGERLLYASGGPLLVSVALADGASAPGPQFSTGGALVLALARGPDGHVLVSYETDGSHFVRLPVASAVTVAPSDCAAEVRAFLEKRFAQLRGLPAACRVDDVATELGGRAALDSSCLGEQRRQASFQVAVVPGFTDPIRVWYDQGGLLMLYADFPEPPGGWTALRAALGSPEAKLDYRWGVVTVAGGEWVYPSRGLSVFLTPALDRVVQIADFAPTSLTAYRRSLRPMSEEEEFPLP